MTTRNLQSTEIASARRDANIEAVKQGYAAFSRGDVETLTKLFHPEATWETPGRTAIGGLRKGHEEVFGQFGRYMSGTNGTFTAQLRYVVGDDEGRVIAFHRNTGERNGKQLGVDCCIVFEVQDGKVVSGRENFFDLYAWDDFWA